MSIRVAQGGTIPGGLLGTYVDSTGAVIDPVTPLVRIYDPNDLLSSGPTTPIRDSVGQYHHPYTAAVDAIISPLWRAHWTGIVNSVPVAADEYFEVVAPGSIEFPGSSLDLLSLAEAKRAVNIDAANTDHDVELASYITAVSEAMDATFGPIVQRTVSEAHDGGDGFIIPTARPVVSITSLVERSGTTSQTLVAENFAAPTAYDYLLDPETGIIYRRSGGGAVGFRTGQLNIRLTAVAGRFGSTSTVGARWKQGACIMLSHLWRPEQGVPTGPLGPDQFDAAPGTPYFAVPNAVKQLLADQRLAPGFA